MDIYEYLKDNKLQFREYKHPAVFTVSESSKIKEKIPGMHTKSLFLRDNKNNYYLICMNAHKRLDTKLLKYALGIKEIHFASSEELKKELNLTPGSVSIFGMINSKSARLIIDEDIWNSEYSGFHPNINTSTLIISKEDLRKFYNLIKSDKSIMKLH